ncbi:DUF2934 domain-containing protein [Sinorhizobium glycinis]|uniref:DUF2934 domain-containing protein n=1 Tax=Sinorhizobium glycinis TaxID=1472378 RepID=UPI0009EDF870|nr:DUF2934 domain-containing protein [Sinorhizobium glycinis]
MAGNKKRNEDPVEGSRETIERELERPNQTGTEPSDQSTDEKRERIRRRAYEIWEREGRPDGGHERHWHEAEKQLDEEEGRTSGHGESGGR